MLHIIDAAKHLGAMGALCVFLFEMDALPMARGMAGGGEELVAFVFHSLGAWIVLLLTFDALGSSFQGSWRRSGLGGPVLRKDGRILIASREGVSNVFGGG